MDIFKHRHFKYEIIIWVLLQIASKEIDRRLRKTSRNIGDILHSDGHSQSTTAKSTRDSKQHQSHNSEKSR